MSSVRMKYYSTLFSNYKQYCRFNGRTRKNYLNVRHGSTKDSTKTPDNKKSSSTPLQALDTKFDNSETAFKSKTTAEILRAYMVYLVCSSDYLVNNNMKLMKKAHKVLGEKIFNVVMKSSFYGHFVGGEDQERIKPVIARLQAYGVKPILDYSVEEDLSRDEAQSRELKAITSEVKEPSEAPAIGGEMPQYKVDKSFSDRRVNVQGARTHFYLNEKLCDKNTEIFKQCVEAVAATGPGGMGAIKMTALGRPQLLLQLSEVIMRARQFTSDVLGEKGKKGPVILQKLSPEKLEQRLSEAGIKDTKKFLSNVVKDEEGVMNLFPWSGILNKDFSLNETVRVPSLKEKRMVRLMSQLSKNEEEMFRNMVKRLHSIFQLAQKRQVSVMVDAEQSYFQPAISRITLELMNIYNKECPTVYNTYQCYLKAALDEVTMDLEQAKRQKFNFAAKLVRGAYMDQERARAKAMNYPDPINPTFDATSDMYHKTFLECFRRINEKKADGKPAGQIKIMVASHNEDTVRFAVEHMKKANIKPDEGVISFAQLLRMCDYISFPLGQAGYTVFKYVPYGPVKDVLPYLSRRGKENKGVFKKVKKEKKLLLTELVRRVKTGQVFYKPKSI